MDLINHYMYAVLRHMPAPRRMDSEKDIRAMIDEQLRERMQKEPGSSHEKSQSVL